MFISPTAIVLVFATFCVQAVAATQIHPNSNNAKCLDVRSASFVDGSPVQIFDCNGTRAQQWSVRASDSTIRVVGTNLCLDAGTTLQNGSPTQIRTCNGSASQKWVYTVDKTIARPDQAQCVDLPSGLISNGIQVQAWECVEGNANQVWTLS